MTNVYIKTDDRGRDTILAALRFYQLNFKDLPQHIIDLAENDRIGHEAMLSDNDIDSLCENDVNVDSSNHDVIQMLDDISAMAQNLLPHDPFPEPARGRLVNSARALCDRLLRGRVTS